MKVFIVIAALLVVAVSARDKSECEKHREKALDHETIMKLIPKCKENGDYEELQCYEDSKFCVCYDKKGHAASPLLTTLKRCDCHLKRHEKLKFKDVDVTDSYLPQCNPEGGFNKKQCWAKHNSCWCVNEQNVQVGDSFRENDDREC